MIEHRRDGTIKLTDDANPARTETIAAGTAKAEVDSRITAFFGPYVPQESGWDRISPRELTIAILRAFRQENIITSTAMADRMRDSVVDFLKR